MLGDEVPADLVGEAPHLVLGAGAVGIAAGVPDVHEVLVREQVDQGSGDRQAPETGVEHPDRSVVARHRRRL